MVVVTRPASAYKDKDRPALEESLASLQEAGVRILFKANIHQKFAVADVTNPFRALEELERDLVGAGIKS